MEYKIEDYVEELKPLCDVCRKSKKCADKNRICLAKKLAWNLSRKVYKQRVKKGLIEDGNC